jgi:hypothetical protein
MLSCIKYFCPCFFNNDNECDSNASTVNVNEPMIDNKEKIIFQNNPIYRNVRFNSVN